jgi:hypothetical protein
MKLGEKELRVFGSYSIVAVSKPVSLRRDSDRLILYVVQMAGEGSDFSTGVGDNVVYR